MIQYRDEISLDDIEHLFSYDRVINTEISLLLGLTVQEYIDWDLPSHDTVNRYIGETKSLLEALHRSMIGENPLADTLGEGQKTALVEAMFYSGDSPYYYQYWDIFRYKYQRDNEWIKTYRGFSISDALLVSRAIISVMQRNATPILEKIVKSTIAETTFLDSYKVTIEEISDESRLPIKRVESILKWFTFDDPSKNLQFDSVHSFNMITSTPILKIDKSTIAIFGFEMFLSSLYQSPYYWMMNDDSYRTIAGDNRGLFLEDYCYDKLKSVMGEHRIYKRVKIFETANKTAGEIDVLCIYGNRMIILQAKTKGLTLLSRSGDLEAIKSDFDKSVQQAYDQAVACSMQILGGFNRLIDDKDEPVEILGSIDQIYPICVLSEHYPALTYHVHSSLVIQDHPTIARPIVTDVFLLDTLTEMLSEPVLLFDYIHKRCTLRYNLLAGQERTVISYYLQHNLHHQRDYSTVFMFDDIGADLDLAMAARREGLPTKTFPEGFLYELLDSPLGRVIGAIQQTDNLAMIEFMFSILALDTSMCKWINKKVGLLLAVARNDGLHHDISVPVNDPTVGGFTIHCGPPPMGDREGWLRMHCILRRYYFHKDRWLGLYFSASSGMPEFAIGLDDEWREDPQLERLMQTHEGTGKLKVVSRKKIGRNERCYCGSGKKYKKCCMLEDQQFHN